VIFPPFASSAKAADHPIRMTSGASRSRTLGHMIEVSEAPAPQAEHLEEWRDASKRVLRAYQAWCAGSWSDRHRLHVAFLEALRREEQAARRVERDTAARSS
jgi:hypothetical protein